MSEKRASVKDIAAKLHISLSTVHKALTGKPGVSDARRAQVLQVAEELGYVVNTAAQSLARKPRTLGVIIPSAWQEYFAEMKRGIEQEIAALAEQKVSGAFLFLDEHTSSEEISAWLQAELPDAVLVCASSSRLSAAVETALADSDRSAFWVGGGIDYSGSLCSITIDAPLSGKLAADFFAAAGSPIRAAGFTGSLSTKIHKAKMDAFCERIAAHGGTVLAICETDDSEERAYALVGDLFRQHPDVNCIYVSTSTSSAVCRYIEEHSLVGRVRIIGTDVFGTLCDAIKRGTMSATIYQNQEKVGRAAVSAAYEFLDAKSSYGRAGEQQEKSVLIPPTLLLKANIE